MRRVLYFGTYDRTVGRNSILVDGLRAVGVEVVECHAPLWDGTTEKLEAVRGGGADLGTLARYAKAAPVLTSRYRAAGPFDAMVVGSTGLLDLPLARWLSSRARKPLVFDPLVSVAETVRDRGLLGATSRRMRVIGRVERRMFALPDRVIADTGPHADAFARDMALDRERIAVVPAGAPAAFRSRAEPYRPMDRPLRVVYFGQYIPLHGLPTVLGAAVRLRDRSDVVFELVGRGQTLEDIRGQAAALRLSNVRFTVDWLTPERLASEHIARADVCLGAFGAQPKAQLVVPFKVYTGLASGRAVLTAETPAVVDTLRPTHEVWTVPPDDDQALAAAIDLLASDPKLRVRLAVAGQQAYDDRFSAAVLGSRLRDVLAEAT